MPKASLKKRPQDQKLAQKRLQMVKRQLYGAEESRQATNYGIHSTVKQKADSTAKNPVQQFAGSFTFKRHDTPVETVKKYAATLDIDYLKKDLTKILALSTAAVGTQIGLYLLARNQVIKF